MTIKVLGPIDTGAEPLSPREKAMFAALVLRQGTAMSPDELAEAYWGENLAQEWGHLPGRTGVLPWSLDPEKQVTAARRLAGRELTADEWASYLGDLGPQKPICKAALG